MRNFRFGFPCGPWLLYPNAPEAKAEKCARRSAQTSLEQASRAWVIEKRLHRFVGHLPRALPGTAGGEKVTSRLCNRRRPAYSAGRFSFLLKAMVSEGWRGVGMLRSTPTRP